MCSQLALLGTLADTLHVPTITKLAVTLTRIFLHAFSLQGQGLLRTHILLYGHPVIHSVLDDLLQPLSCLLDTMRSMAQPECVGCSVYLLAGQQSPLEGPSQQVLSHHVSGSVRTEAACTRLASLSLLEAVRLLSRGVCGPQQHSWVGAPVSNAAAGVACRFC